MHRAKECKRVIVACNLRGDSSEVLLFQLQELADSTMEASLQLCDRAPND
jgi:hypothetical protein